MPPPPCNKIRALWLRRVHAASQGPPPRHRARGLPGWATAHAPLLCAGFLGFLGFLASWRENRTTTAAHEHAARRTHPRANNPYRCASAPVCIRARAGPRSGIIFAKKELMNAIDFAVCFHATRCCMLARCAPVGASKSTRRNSAFPSCSRFILRTGFPIPAGWPTQPPDCRRRNPAEGGLRTRL